MTQVLFVYGFEPSGHASAARALEAAARLQGHETRRVNVSSDYHPHLGPLVAWLYLKIILRFPRLWSALYDNAPVAMVARSWRRIYLAVFGGRMRRTLSQIAPDAVVCTHATVLAAVALAKQKDGCRWPLVAVVTDYQAHSYWVDPQVDLYIAPTPQAAASLVERGTPVSRVVAAGIPIHPTFAQALSRQEARKRLGLPADSSVIFLCGGSRGLGRLEEMASVLLESLADAQILAACGSNSNLARDLQARFGASGRLRAYASLEAAQIKELMCASDLLVGKAGGLTMAEALAVGLPMLLFEPIVGQEARNAAYLSQAGAAVCASSLEALASSARLLLQPGALEPLRARALAWGRPNASQAAIKALSNRKML